MIILINDADQRPTYFLVRWGLIQDQSAEHVVAETATDMI